MTLDCKPHLTESLAWKVRDLHANEERMENMEILYVTGRILFGAGKYTHTKKKQKHYFHLVLLLEFYISHI